MNKGFGSGLEVVIAEFLLCIQAHMNQERQTDQNHQANVHKVELRDHEFPGNAKSGKLRKNRNDTKCYAFERVLHWLGLVVRAVSSVFFCSLFAMLFTSSRFGCPNREKAHGPLRRYERSPYRGLGNKKGGHFSVPPL